MQEKSNYNYSHADVALTITKADQTLLTPPYRPAQPMVTFSKFLIRQT